MAEQHRFRKKCRICDRASFDRVFSRRCAVGNAQVTLHVAENTCGHVRLGIAAGRRLGNAVIRNRAKRIVREAFRQLQHVLPPVDIVCVIRKPDPVLAEVMECLPQLARQALRKLQRRA